MVRLIISVVLLLLSLLTVFPAPHYYLWYVAILVTEFPWIFILLTLALLSFWWGAGGLYWLSNLVLVSSFVLFSVPIAQAYFRTIQLDFVLDLFSPTPGREPQGNYGKPFSITKMITGIGKRQLSYKVITYSPEHNLTLDYYHAQATGARPCVVVIHGGSWRNGDSRQLPELNTVLAEAGYNVASINYRKVPQCLSPGPVEDLATALQYLRSNAAGLNIDPQQFVLLGRSAGGQIALMGGYTMQNLGVKAVISYYGPADMIWGYQNPANLRIYNSCQVLEDYMGGSYAQVPAQYAAGSPIEFVDSNSVPTLMIYGQNDVWVAYGHATRLGRKLDQYKVPNYLLTLPWATHGFDYTLNGPGGQLATYSVLRFLEGVL